MRSARRLPPALVIGGAMGASLLVLAVVAPLIWGDTAERLTSTIRSAPNPEHLLGTDQLGRDILARTLTATRLTIVMAFGATALSVMLGVAIGGLAWVSPQRVREIILRVIDASVAFPALVLALVVAAILGPGTVSAVVAIGVAGIPSFARLTSNMIAMVAGRDFVSTARLLGVPATKIFTRHLLPNVSGPLLILITSSLSLALLEIASLSFVGLGVQAPAFDFGALLSDGLRAIYTQPWQAIAPSIMLLYIGISAMLIGDGLAAMNDPRFRRPIVRGARAKAETAALVGDDQALLEVSDLRVIAPDGTELVKSVNFGIRPGEILGLVGESGSGKSMTAMAVAGLLADGIDATAARLRLGDMDLLRENSPKRLATEIGLVYQDPGSTFNPALRMGVQLTEVARVHLGLSRTKATRQIVSALEQVRIRTPEDRLSQHPFHWSGGMLQRASIASATLEAPKLLIADEPTTALDVTVQVQVLREIRAINRADKTAVLFISHDIGVVQELCDSVLVMRSGEIVERLTGEQLKRAEVSHPYTKELLAAMPEFAAGDTPRSTGVSR